MDKINKEPKRGFDKLGDELHKQIYKILEEVTSDEAVYKPRRKPVARVPIDKPNVLEGYAEFNGDIDTRYVLGQLVKRVAYLEDYIKINFFQQKT